MNITIRSLISGTIALFISAHAWSWTNHTLVSHELVRSMPQVSEQPAVKVESLESFLMANEEALVELLANDEAWMAENLWQYKVRPDALAFKATGNKQDVVKRFTYAIRLNPKAKFAMYLQGMPGSRLSGEGISAEQISVFKDHGHLTSLSLQALKEGDTVAPIDVIVTANDEPDHGHDIGLFTDSGTDYGKEFGFGPLPFGNPNLEYATQAPFHMGFYHEPSIIYAVAGFLKETYPQMRIHQFETLAKFAFANGHDYWGYRFMGWGLHYIGDLTNPYHTTPVPGNSVLSTLWLGILGIIGFPEYQADAIQLVSNRHAALEDFQYSVMSTAYKEHQVEHATIKALQVLGVKHEYNDNSVIDVFTKRSAGKADAINAILLDSFPYHYMQDPKVEYTKLNALPMIEQTVKQEAGEEGYNSMIASVSDLLGDFSIHGSAYIREILKAKH